MVVRVLQKFKCFVAQCLQSFALESGNYLELLLQRILSVIKSLDSGIAGSLDSAMLSTTTRRIRYISSPGASNRSSSSLPSSSSTTRTTPTSTTTTTTTPTSTAASSEVSSWIPWANCYRLNGFSWRNFSVSIAGCGYFQDVFWGVFWLF